MILPLRAGDGGGMREEGAMMRTSLSCQLVRIGRICRPDGSVAGRLNQEFPAGTEARHVREYRLRRGVDSPPVLAYYLVASAAVPPCYLAFRNTVQPPTEEATP